MAEERTPPSPSVTEENARSTAENSELVSSART